jgi:hypothetical protein
MKEKNYDLEGIDSRLSKQTHRTNMTGKTEITSTCSVTTKKYAIHFKQQKTDLNAEKKKNALLEQHLQKMEAALATGGISSTPKETRLIPSISKAITSAASMKTITIATPAVSQAHILAEKTITQLILPPTPSDNSAKAGSTTTNEVDRWDLCLPVALLLQVDIGGVDESPLWRIIMDQLNKQTKTNLNIVKARRRMVG